MRQYIHTETLLYEYICGVLDMNERKIVEDHLATCQQCASDAQALRTLITVLNQNLRKPSDERSPEFWNDFYLNVRERIRLEKQTTKELSPTLWERLEEFFIIPQRRVVALSGMIVVILLAVALLKRDGLLKQESTVELITEQPAQVDTVAERMSKYFRRSRNLLVGLTNMETNEDQLLDFSMERNTSRQLVQEARYLKNQPMDMRSARLIDDLEKILIELANLETENDLPNVDLVRSGIHQGNLLFKIRMAEAVYDTSRFRTTNYSF